ncbi:MAG: signal peptidase I [Cytophagales bacterium]|nr:signal peptidase I [Rhizobacter sp.]
MQIGFSVNEILFLLSLASGACWVVWRRRLKRFPLPERKPFWVSLGAELFIVIGLMFTCRVALADWPRVPSGSMEPTLRVGDYLLVNHLAYGPRLPFTNTAIETGRPQRGDVVVFRYPLDVSEFYVKRLVGLPGDVVRFQNGLVSVNGEVQPPEMLSDGSGPDVREEDRGHWLMRETVQQRQRVVKLNPFVQGRLAINLKQPGLAEHCRVEDTSIWQCTVPAGQYLMLGDNRDNSEDSRVWGFLPHEQVYGKAVRVLFNWSDLSRSWTAL